MNNRRRALFIGGATAAICGAQVSSFAQPAFEPAVSINEIMVFVIDHNSHAIWDVAENPPSAEPSWHLLEHSALTLAAAGNLINAGGTGPDDNRWVQETSWRAYSQAMTNAGLAALAAVRAEDTEGLLAAGNDLLNSCLGCHREYKPELPHVTAQPHMHRP